MNCAKHDAALTHPNTICLQANAFFAMAIAHTIRTAVEPAYRFSHK
jgi:ADP-ribosylglycohydrolase